MILSCVMRIIPTIFKMSTKMCDVLVQINYFRLVPLLMTTVLLISCQQYNSPQAGPVESLPAQSKISAKIDKNQSLAPPSTTPQSAKNSATSPTPISPTMTSTLVPSSTPFPTAVFTPSPTPIGPCDSRMPGDDLLAVVTLDYNISRDYKPSDLVPLAGWLPVNVTMGYPSEIRSVALDPLLTMIEAMQAEGLAPRVMSAYRSYAAQSIAWNKWNELYPDHASIISAPPGHSEHQLGTVIDFGSPELADLVGQEDIEFHTLFYKTSEGSWLTENAHKYGFTLSYPLEAFEVTGFYYEPWHYRYVGIETATMLHQNKTSLTEYQLANNSEPCIP